MPSSCRAYDWKSGNRFQTGSSPVQPGSLESESGIFALAFDKCARPSTLSLGRLLAGGCASLGITGHQLGMPAEELAVQKSGNGLFKSGLRVQITSLSAQVRLASGVGRGGQVGEDVARGRGRDARDAPHQLPAAARHQALLRASRLLCVNWQTAANMAQSLIDNAASTSGLRATSLRGLKLGERCSVLSFCSF